jgi:hypothetical protein
MNTREIPGAEERLGLGLIDAVKACMNTERQARWAGERPPSLSAVICAPRWLSGTREFKCLHDKRNSMDSERLLCRGWLYSKFLCICVVCM